MLVSFICYCEAYFVNFVSDSNKKAICCQVGLKEQQLTEQQPGIYAINAWPHTLAPIILCEHDQFWCTYNLTQKQMLSNQAQSQLSRKVQTNSSKQCKLYLSFINGDAIKCPQLLQSMDLKVWKFQQIKFTWDVSLHGSLYTYTFAHHVKLYYTTLGRIRNSSWPWGKILIFVN